MKQEECNRTRGAAAPMRIAQHDGDRLLVFIADAVGDDPARTISRGQIGLGHAIDQLLALAAMLDELLDGDDLQRVLLARRIELVAIGAVAVVGKHFAKHTRRLEPRHPRHVDGGFGVTGAAEHPALFGNQRKQVSRAGKVARLAGRIEDGQNRRRPLLGRNARPCADMVDGNREIRSQRGRVILHHGMEIESAAEFRQ